MNPQPIKNTDIVFLGDSLTEGFDLLKYFGRNDLRNRGMGGNMTDHILYRLEEITNAKPQKVFLMIGINDLYQQQNPDLVFNNIVNILNIIYNETPQSSRYLQSILPVNETNLLSGGQINTNIYKMNNRLKEHYAGRSTLTFIDLHSDFLNHYGQMDEKYTFDGVHLTPEGYNLWANLLHHYLDD
jgi:lysophospholipase L1-like esterase